MPYGYTVRMPSTSVTASKTLLQIKAGNAAVWVIETRIIQVTKLASEIWELQWLRKSAAATVTSATPAPLESTSPAALAVGGTAATGYNASAEGTNSTILQELGFNILNAEYARIPVPEGRVWAPVAGIIGLLLVSTPAAAANIIVEADIVEFQG